MFEISSSPVRAVIVTPHVSSVPALVMNIFEPLTPGAVPQLRCRAGGAGVRARVWLGEPERGQPAAGGEVREPPFLLLLGAEEVDRHRPERGVGGDGDRDGRVDPRQLLDRDRVGDGVAARAAVALVDRDAHQAEPGHLVHEPDGEARLAIELLGDGRDPLARERADGVADQLLLGSKVEVHAGRDGSRAASAVDRPVPADAQPDEPATSVPKIFFKKNNKYSNINAALPNNFKLPNSSRSQS